MKNQEEIMNLHAESGKFGTDSNDKEALLKEAKMWFNQRFYEMQAMVDAIIKEDLKKIEEILNNF